MTSWRTFLSTVLPEEGTGFYCIGSYKNKKDIPLTELRDTIEGAEKVIQEYLDLKRDVYFGVSKFITKDNRQAINAGWNKAFFLDIDCGKKYADERKGYLTQVEALEELGKFCTTLGLPKPNVVLSGNGIHVSWVLKETILKDEWKKTATKLRKQVVNLGLIVDASKVTDSAMVLRIPDTLNFKSNPPKQVIWKKQAPAIDYEEFDKKVSAGLENLGLDLTNPPRRALTETDRNLQKNYSTNFANIMKTKGCLQLLNAYANQATLEEPVWRGALSIAKFCEDRDTAIHKLSSKHPEYTREATERKTNEIKGPYSCAKFDEVNPGGCEGCINRGKVDYPIKIGSKILAATAEDNIVVLPSVELGKEVKYVIPELPNGYFRGKNGGIYKQGFIDNDTGEVIQKDKLIYKHDFYIVKRMEDSELGEMVWMRLHLPKDGVREFACAGASLMSVDKFKDIVGKQGVIANPNQIKELMEYITDFTNELQARDKAEKMRVQFGWHDDDTKFVVGEREISKDGIAYSPPSSKTLMFASWMKSKGSMSEWKRVVNSYGAKGKEARAFLFFAGLGTPFLKFTEKKGVVYSITENESGTGKTTIQKVINSIYGHPEDLMLIKGDTVKAQFLQMGVYNNIPICVDEVTDMTNEATSSVAYGISQGRSNNRMKAHTNELRENNTRWATSAFMSGNSSMHDKISALKATPEAEQLRVIEIEIQADNTMTKEEADELFDNVLYNNYGMAIDILMEYAVPNLEAVKKLLKETQNRFDKEAGLTSKQRFYSAGVAAAFTGAKLGKQLGIHDIDTKPVWDWAVEYISNLKDSVKSAKRDPGLTLGMFLNSHNRNLLVVDDGTDRRTGLTKAPLKEPFDKLLVRFEPDTNHVYIDSDYFQSWCTEKQIAYRSTLSELKKMGADASVVRKAMANGTLLSTPPVNAIRLDNAVLKLMDSVSLSEEPTSGI
jgi:hypothetical protein